MQLEGKVGLVTGGTRGIGAAAAIALAKAGADVALVGRTDDDEARQTRAVIQGLGRRCELILADCAKPADATRCVEETAQRLGGVDVLVHSAGGPVNGGLLELTPEAWHSGFDVHVHAIFYLCRAAIPLMRPKREGAIILISSTAGKLATPSHIAYQAVKGAIPHLTRGLAREKARGEVPSPLNPPPGCTFNPRCPHATDHCRSAAPVLAPVEDGHLVSCWRAEEFAAAAV